MIPVTVSELSGVLGLGWSGPGAAGARDDGDLTSVTADSRTVTPGALFVALPGERVDGHDHVPAAVSAGARVCLTSRPIPGAPCLVVDDPLIALGRFSRYLVERASAAGLRVVGITGSQGKTSTKDLLAQALEPAGPTVAPAGNLNNELGVPLTVSRVTDQTRFLVAEMGARGIGHIRYLCEIAPPRIGVVLNVGQAHIGEFGSQQAIAQAKGELVEALPADGVAVLNADDPLVWGMRSRTAAAVLAFSDRGDPGVPGVWASTLQADPQGCYGFRLHDRAADGSEAQLDVQLRVMGRHQVANACAAAATARSLGLDLIDIAGSLGAAITRSRWRMEVRQRDDGVTVINDAYNANPDSTRAAVDALAEIGRGGRRTWAVLGDMLELGDSAAAEHEAIGTYVAEQGIDTLIAIGTFADRLVAGAVTTGRCVAAHGFPVKSEATLYLTNALRPGDVVLVKASRGLALDTVAEQIRTVASAEADPYRSSTKTQGEGGQ